MSRAVLIALFTLILISMLCVTGWASWTQPLWQWGGLKSSPDLAWTIATLMDAYCGFITFFVWVFYKERSLSSRIAWFAAILLLGNIAMASYVLLALRRLSPHADLQQLLVQRNG